MVQSIVNAAPMVIEYGTDDQSIRALPREPEAIPQHLPKFFLYTQKGPADEQLVSGAELVNTYGAKSFDVKGKYFNHSTLFTNLAVAEGNAVMIKRLIPADANGPAELTLYLDVLTTTVDLYQRNSDGSIFKDVNDQPVIIGTTAGYKVKWVVGPTTINNTPLGTLPIVPGDQTDLINSVQSQRYPIFTFKVSSVGEHGNLAGIRLWAPVSSSFQAMPTSLMDENKAYPFYISVVKKPSLDTSPKTQYTIFGETKVLFTLKENTIDPLTDKQLYINDVFLDAYQNLSDLRYPKLFGEFGDIAIYQDNIDTLLTMFHTAEQAHINQFSDITVDPDTMYLINLITGVSSFNVPYSAIQMVESVTSTRLTEFTNLYASGGSDGTMTDALHSELVAVEMDRYLDQLDPLMDLVTYPESIIYDTGFTIPTKLKLCQFVGLRKDTFVILGTHVVGGQKLTASEEHSLAVSLRTRLQLFPESDYFGTPVMRGLIMGRSGLVRGSNYKQHVPLTAEILIKSARYMGASNARWQSGLHFDGAPGCIVENMYDINISWVPTSVRNRNWDAGLNWVQAYDRRSFFFPALKTAYTDDTSVLNSYFTAMAIAWLNKVSHAAWREYTGVSHLTNDQLAARIDDFISERTQYVFDNRFVIEPNTYFTDLDLARGFSWTTVIKIYAANMKTVMTTWVEAHRIDDLPVTQ